MSPMISVVSWAAGPTSAPVIPKTFHNPGTPFDGGGGASNGYGSIYMDGGGTGAAASACLLYTSPSPRDS